MDDEIKILIEDSCPYISRKKREECWKGENCNELYFDNYSGGVTCPKVIREICGYGGELEVRDLLSIMENAYGKLEWEIKEEILLDRLEDEIMKAFSTENVRI